MKKNRTTKIAIIVLALVLATSCFVGTTLAKYTTKITGTDSARVAKWGVELAITTETFEATYQGINGISVKNLSTDGKDLITAGTKKDDAITFTISGAPEVDVDVLVTLDANNALSMVTLPAGTYDDVTNYNAATQYEVATNYYPVVWTLKFTPEGSTAPATTLKTGNLQEIEDYLRTEITGHYDVDSEEFATLIGTYTISWDWTFEGNDVEDTLLGNAEAGIITIPGYVAEETFELLITVTQVD